MAPRPRRGRAGAFGRTARRLWRNKLALGALGMLLVIFATALFADLLAPHDPAEGAILDRLLPPSWHAAGRQGRLLGTDQVGRDVLSRLIHGARVSLLIGMAGTAVSLVAGTGLGLVSGFLGGPIDRTLLRITDIQLAFPFIALAVVVISVTGPGLVNVILVLAATGWVLYARVVREEVLSARERSYVEAARAMGGTDARIMWRHILPNVVAPVIVISSFAIAQMIITEASLSFLGLGIRPPTPTWGGMLSDARNYMQVAWWLPTFPGVALLVTLLAINLTGDWLRDVLDPALRGAE
jgi:peptide/nickel transport system permease protein